MIEVEKPGSDVRQESPSNTQSRPEVGEALRKLETIGREAAEAFADFAQFSEARREIIAKTAARYWLARSLRRQMAKGCEELDSQILRTAAGGVMVRVEKLLLRLDAVESRNDETVRFVRRQLVSRLSTQLGEMEKFMEKLKRLIAFQAEKDSAARELLDRNSPKKKPFRANEAVALGVEHILGSAGLLPPLDAPPSSGMEEVATPAARRSSTSSLSSSSSQENTPTKSSTKSPTESPTAPQQRMKQERRHSPPQAAATTQDHHTREEPAPRSRRPEEAENEPLEEPEYTVQDRKHAVVITVRDEEARRCEIELRGREGTVLSVRVPGRRRVHFALDPEKLNVRQATKELLGRNVLQIVVPKRRLAAVPSHEDEAAFRDFFMRGWPRF